MHDLPRQKLLELIAKHGHGLCDDAKRLEGMLRDSLRNEHKRETFVLVSALREGVVDDFRNSANGVPLSTFAVKMVRQLQDNLGLDEAAASWGVETWAFALGIKLTLPAVRTKNARPPQPGMGSTSAAVADRVLGKIAEWRRQLLDLSKRNRLINCRIGPRGVLHLEHPSAEEIWNHLVVGNGLMRFPLKSRLVPPPPGLTTTNVGRTLFDRTPIDSEGQPAAEWLPEFEECLLSRKLGEHDILTRQTDRQLQRRLRRLNYSARSSLDEQGVNILFAAFGMLTWYESPDSDVAFTAPLLLVPVTLSQRGPEAEFELCEYEDEVISNLCVREMLSEMFRCKLPDFADDQIEKPGGRQAYFDAVLRAVHEDKGRERWSIRDEVVLGTFSFQKVPMWQDLGKNAEEIARHPLCRAMAGDAEFSLANVSGIPGPHELDSRVHPKDIHTILDCDSSQLQAVIAAQKGASLVVDGPPGTGKSQTIANLIAEFLAAGKSVLFVSEKSAALEVVKRRLDQCQLGDFCLALHSHQANKKDVIAELGRCLALPDERYKDQSSDLQRLAMSREQLNRYVQSLHLQRPGLGLSPFAAHGRLAKLGAGPISDCPLPDVLNLSFSRVRDIEDRLRSLTLGRAVIDEYSRHPWRGCRANGFSLSLEDELRQTLSGLEESLAATAAPLQVLRFFRLLGERPTQEQVLTVSKSVKPLLDSPLLSETWFANPHELAESVQKLHAVSSTYRELLASLPPFDQDCLETEKLGECLTTALRLRREDRARAPTLPDERLRTRTSQWQTFNDELAQLLEKVVDVQNRLDDFIRALRVKFDRDSPFRLLRRMADLGQYLAVTGRVLESWFDDATRKELRRIVAKCQAQVAALQPFRDRLQPRWSAEAFEPAEAGLVEDALKFDSFWKRLFGGWRHVKRQLAKLSAGSLGSLPSVLADLRQLRDFHQEQAKIASLEFDHAADLLRAADNRVDWAATAAGLEQIESLRAQVRIPDRLKQVMATSGMLDRDELARASVALSGSLNAMALAMEKLKRDASLSKLVPFTSGWDELNVSELVSRIHETTGTVTSTIGTFQSVLELLPADIDLTLGVLDRSVKALPRLSALCEQARTAAASLTSLLEVDSSPELLDWSGYATFAKSLADFLAVCGNAPLESLARAAAEPEVKDSLDDAIKRLDEILSGNFARHWKSLGQRFPISSSVSTGVILDQLNLSQLHDWVIARLADLQRLVEWLTFRETEQTLAQLGVTAVLSEILQQKFAVEEAAPAFLRRLYRVWLDAVYQADPVLRAFQVADHERLLQEFRNLDRQSVAGGQLRIRDRLLNSSDRPRANQLNAPPTSELGILTREVEKKRRHLPLRLLFKNVPTLARRLKPCFMMSPLAVSTFLDEAGYRFDVVIFDEASQVHPHDAIGAVYRGQQLIVAGDQKQLPPSKFFERMVNDDGFGDFESDSEDSAEATSNLSDFESILDVCCSVGLPRQRLRWHYRSRREPLIAFSNRHFYDSELITFPSVLDASETSAVALHYVPDGRWQSGKSGGFNAGEARATVELIRQHMIEHPNQSLGVITLNLRQQMAVLDELDELQRRESELIPWFSPDRDEPFFVKNLENVQGDERDRIMLSVGYGFDQVGKFAMRFGPLNNQGGERRLNVAVTRAKHKVTVVSSIHAQDIDLSRTSAVGVRLLRAYLDFAERGFAVFNSDITEANQREADSEFEESVEAALVAHGFNVHRQVGCSGYRIDLALTHPNQPGRYVLGVECDGASYHSSATARDRDRLRQSVLEQLGWKLIRVWSTDWIRDPSRQIARIEVAFNAALKAIDEDAVEPSDSEKAFSSPNQSLLDNVKVIRPAPPTSYRPRYNDIDAVPSRVLRSTLLDSLRQFGQTPRQELITAVSRELGFGRTGPRIQERIENTLIDLKRTEEVIEVAAGCRLNNSH